MGPRKTKAQTDPGFNPSSAISRKTGAAVPLTIPQFPNLYNGDKQPSSKGFNGLAYGNSRGPGWRKRI